MFDDRCGRTTGTTGNTDTLHQKRRRLSTQSTHTAATTGTTDALRQKKQFSTHLFNIFHFVLWFIHIYIYRDIFIYMFYLIIYIYIYLCIYILYVSILCTIAAHEWWHSLAHYLTLSLALILIKAANDRRNFYKIKQIVPLCCPIFVYIVYIVF